MLAKSKAQQALFGMALAVRKGEMKRSEVDKNVLDIVPTLNGYHLISHGFNPLDFLQNIQELPKPDIQRDNPTLLYYAQ